MHRYTVTIGLRCVLYVMTCATVIIKLVYYV